VLDQAAEQIWRRLAACLIATVAGLGLAAIVTLDVSYVASRWPDKQPPEVAFFSANDRSRWCTVWSLVERGTYRIDEIIQRPGWDSIDKVKVDGHFYSTKPALFPTLVAGLYRAGKPLRLDLDRRPHVTIRVLLGLVNLLPWLVALAALASLLEHLTVNVSTRLIVLVAAGFGTFLTPFLITLNNHTPAAVGTILTLWLVWPVWSGADASRWRFAACGFFAAWTTCNELPAFVFSTAIGLVCLRASWPKTLTAFFPAAAIPLGAFFLTTYATTGSPLPFYTKYGTDAYRYVHEGVPSYWMDPTGIDRGAEPWWVYLFHCTLGHHGIWSLSPLFLLAPVGWFISLRSRENSRAHRELQALGLLLTVWILAFYLAQTKNYNYGGNTAGLRWAFWLIPFWLVGLVPALDRFESRLSLRGAVPVLLAVSVFSAWYPIRNPWQPPWLQVALETLGWPGYELSSPGFPAPKRTWLGAIPEAVGSEIELMSEGPGGVPQTLTLRLLARTGDVATMEITHSHGGARDAAWTDRERLEIDLAAYNRGEGPDKFLRGAAANTDESARQRKLLQGVPTSAEYRGGAVRYLKVPERPEEAYGCLVGTAHVRLRRTREMAELSYRRQVWWADEVPFGVVQMEDVVRDPIDNAILSRVRWQLTRVSRP
jgi:hypothetical protein